MLNMHFPRGKKEISTVISIHNCVQDLSQQKSVNTLFCLYKAAPFILLYAVDHVRGQVTEVGFLEEAVLFSGKCWLLVE